VAHGHQKMVQAQCRAHGIAIRLLVHGYHCFGRGIELGVKLVDREHMMAAKLRYPAYSIKSICTGLTKITPCFP